MTSDDNPDAPLSMDDAVAAMMKAEQPEEAETGQSDDAEPEQAEADEAEQPEGEDIEGDQPDDEGQADEEADKDEEAGRFVSLHGRVKLPDGSIATVEELTKGNLRDRDYRQKTMELAETRKATETKASALTQKETQIAEQADYMSKLLKAVIPEPPDPSLVDTDPVGYMRQQAAHKQWTDHLNYLQQVQQQAKDASQAETAKARQEREREQAALLLERMPELKDETRRKAFAADIQQHLSAYGFSAEDIGNLPPDARQFQVIRDAIAYRKLQASKTKVAAKVEGRPPVQRAGTRQSPGTQQARQVRTAMDRLNKSGSLNDGVAAILALQRQG
jgi:hypothetical protein